jgi:hypothetical protein
MAGQECDPQLYFRCTLPDRYSAEPVTAWECLGQWSLAAVTRAAPILVLICPGLGRDVAAGLLHELADGLAKGGFDRFAVCPSCRPVARDR